MSNKRLQQGQATLTVGVRMPSNTEFELRKATRDLRQVGYNVTKSELIRVVLEQSLSEFSDIYKSVYPEPPALEAK